MSSPIENWLENTLIDLYYESDFVSLDLPSKKRKLLKDYTITDIRRDPLGKKHTAYRLNHQGVTVAEFILKKYNRKTKREFSGIALQSRQWHLPMVHSLSASEVMTGLQEIAKRGEIPVKFEEGDDWTTARFQDLDQGLSRIGYKIEWERNKKHGVTYLTEVCQFGESAAIIFVEFMDPHRKQFRRHNIQQEIVFW